MKSTLACAALAVALLGLGSTAFAADNTTMKPVQPDMMATMMCRPAYPGEKSTATMGTTPLVCEKIDRDKMMSMKKELSAMPGGEAMALQMFQNYTIQQQGTY